ncbi:hypothetical protein OAO16_00205 [Opitutales bacterium]|nr:hypothetical protein [Opitutales bacterium]
MPTLPELYRHHQTQHPRYCNPLASFDPDDEDLNNIKKDALLPYIEDLEEKMIVYKECMVVFAVLFQVETDEEGFRANVWRLNPIYVPEYAYPLVDRKIWTLSCQWKTIRLLEDRINCMPFGWTFWPEKRVVSQIEHKFMKEGRESAHLALRHSANL